MDKLLTDLRHAADNLRAVAHGLRTPLDTSTFEQALKAVEDALKPKQAAFKPPVSDKPVF